MKPTEIRKLIKKLHVDPSAEMRHRTLVDALDAQAESPKTESAESHLGLSSTTVRSKVTRLAAAAVIVIAVGFLVIHTRPRPQAGTDTISPAAKSPGEMMTAMSLKIAYRRGGLEAVEKQCDKAFRMLGLRPTRISIRELLDESNGEEPERKKS
jgi:hypothetical protein